MCYSFVHFRGWCGLIYLWPEQQNVWYQMQPYTINQTLRNIRLRDGAELMVTVSGREMLISLKNVNFQLRDVQYFHRFG